MRDFSAPLRGQAKYRLLGVYARDKSGFGVPPIRRQIESGWTLYALLSKRDLPNGRDAGKSSRPRLNSQSVAPAKLDDKMNAIPCGDGPKAGHPA